MITIPSDLFIAFSRDNIRVLLNWERMASEAWLVEVSVETDVSLWYAPWYQDENAQEVDFRSPRGRPVLLPTVADRLDQLAPRRREAVIKFSAQFRKQNTPVQLVVPAYALGKGRYLLLDGNHRLAGLLHAGVAFRAMFLTIHGPIDPECLPDLAHWRDG